ncbi:AMP-binding protein [Hyalangium rubrum]|uniref:AMP-binding protein n=1 Tax=Hyalangium rubrum TaxID=3103134 RepID=A0ABU5H9L4_9BACT|nr:AMP-binding protein [Hyalangium sp. s54d21]MDY7229513.1 AMP-binding protein [Hyalangium sp. s54d21]
MKEHAHTASGGPRPVVKEARTFADVLRRRAAELGPAPAFTFLGTEGTGSGDVTLTYAEVDRRARAIALELETRGLSGQRVLIVLPPGPTYLASLFGCFYAGAIAVPVPSPLFEGQRQGAGLLAAIAQDSGAAAALVGGEPPALAGHIELIAAESIVPRAMPLDWMPQLPDSRSLALLQYTAGNNGTPKGVRVTHANLLDNAEGLRRGFGHCATDKILLWLPTHQGLGLIEGVLQPLYAGISSVLMQPQAFFERPVRWLEAMSAHGATISGAPDFAYELCVRTVTENERSRLDLSRWRIAFSSGEQVRAETLERFSAHFGPRGFQQRAFRPVYGLAECTYLVAGGKSEGGPTLRGVAVDALAQQRITERPGAATKLVSCGPASTSVQVLIVNPSTRAPRGDQEIGEVWLSGLSVADGYWGRVATTEEAFRGRLASSASGTRAFLRTGDLGACVGGDLYLTGRVRDVVIWEGMDLRLHDLEFDAAASHPAVVPGSCAAFALKPLRDEQLTLVAEVFPPEGPTLTPADEQARLREITRAIRRNVGQRHGVMLAEICLARAFSLPRSSTGHVSRSAVRTAHLASEYPLLLSDRAHESSEKDTKADVSPVAVPAPVPSVPLAEKLPAPAQVPLTPSMYAVHDPARALQNRMGASRVFELPEGTEAFHLAEALHAVWSAHETLRLRYARKADAGDWAALITPDKVPVPLTRLELASRQDEESWAEVESTARRLGAEVGQCAGPLATFVFCDRGQRKAPWLLAVCHPALMDESSWRILATDLADACEQARLRGRVRLAPQSGSLTQWVQHLVSEAELPRLASEARVHWLARSSTLPPEPSPVANAAETPAPGALAEVNAAALQRTSTLFDVSREALLLAACALAYGTYTRRSAVQIRLEQSARVTSRYQVDASRMLGNLQYVFPVLLPIEPEALPAELARHTHVELSNAPLGGLAYEALRAYGADRSLADALLALPAPDFSMRLEDEGAPSSRGTLRTLAMFNDGPWPGEGSLPLRVEARLSAERVQLLWHGTTSDGSLLSALAKLTEQTLRTLCAHADNTRATTATGRGPARVPTAQRSR